MGSRHGLLSFAVQVFVGNPSKPQPIIDILTNNQGKLLKYLEDFHTDRGEFLPGIACASGCLL
jgi:hypothetical protein